ncbi:MAG TPA: VCBS repeat-containing protein [Xanthobacteraceae bacterium]|nr:VCBS repeat-containing protein [Xanthobacteraceae bacterium]
MPGATPPQNNGTWTTLTNAPSNPNVFLENPLLLTDGTVIAQDECNSDWWKLMPDINGSYLNGTWSQIASLPNDYTPLFYGSGVLPDGRVIIEGGEYNAVGCGNGVWTNQGAIYDPVANTWTAVSPPSGWSEIGDAAGIVLDNGTFMQSDCCNFPPPLSALLNATNLTWTATGSNKADRFDEEGFAKLPNGTVLDVDAHTSGSCGKSSEIYNPSTGAWSSAGNTVDQEADCSGEKSFELGPLVMRQNGTAVIFPGVTTGVVVADEYTVGSGIWSSVAAIPTIAGTPYTLADAPAAVLPDGNILFAASPGNWTSSEEFPLPTHYFELSPGGTITQVADTADAPSIGAFEDNFLLLPTGQVLDLSQAGNLQIYTPLTGTFQASWQPVVNSVLNCLAPSHTYVLSGTQLNGLTEGSYYGDDVQAAVNFPVVRIVNNSTGHVFYAKTFNHSNRSINPGVSVSTSFTVASATETGASTLYDVGAGIPSVGTPITVGSACPGGLTDAHDFNGDGYSDILWRDTSGNMAIWEMNGGTILNPSNSGLGSVSTTWSIVGQRDFNGDGNADILWHDTSGNLAIWEMSGTTILNPSNSGLGSVSTVWSVVGTGDFNGDGYADILWRNTTTGDVAIWEMNGTTILNPSNSGVGTVATNWSVVGVGDFNGDGKADILWQNTSNGNLAIYLMNGTTITSSATFANVGSYSVVGTGDFNGDGKSDILLRDGSGDIAIWEMNGTTILNPNTAGVGNLSTVWSVAETGDFNGDGYSDILWRDTSGDIAIWFMNGTALAGGAGLGSIPTTFTIQGTNAD